MKVDVKVNNKWYKVREIKKVGDIIVYEICKDNGDDKKSVPMSKKSTFQDMIRTYLKMIKN